MPFVERQLTTYRLLGDLCGDHHDLVTHRGYAIVEHADGTWTLQPLAGAAHDKRHTDAA